MRLIRNHKDFNKTFVFGKTVFLTREDAETALKAREQQWYFSIAENVL